MITGWGVISPLGNTPDALWEALQARRSGVALMTSLPLTALPTSIAAEAREFTGHIDDFGPLEGDQKKSVRKGLKVMCREAQMGVAAAQCALADAGFALGKHDPERCGVVYGADYMISAPEELNSSVAACLTNGHGFEFARWASEGMGKMNPLWLLKYLPNMPASHIAIYNDLRGPNNSITHREAAANLAVGEAFRVIARGHAELMIAGATGTRVHPMKAVHAVFEEELAINGREPQCLSRPFDLARGGMVLGEGAGAIVLEELASARARGATIRGEVVGFGSSSVADRDLAPRRDAALANAMRAALRDAGATPGDVGHLHAHGLATRRSDAEEARAIREVFGARADSLPVTAAKSYFGNLGAGGGLVELVASTLALQHGSLFPILNYETPDPECPIVAVTKADVPSGDSFLNLSVTPQGQASCVMVRRHSAAFGAAEAVRQAAAADNDTFCHEKAVAGGRA
ncbi:MAG TPA: beta-ketoacyl-[acyl-carrier-protein] synthase family protein [Pirellulales bacterium]|nr:beta-ketoacyl-[acyl-carrier-protein] synthase family protein [Pirellulales bacterium]